MSSEQIALSTAAIEEDLEAKKAWSFRAQAFPFKTGETLRMRGNASSADTGDQRSEPLGVGRQLIYNCGHDAEKHLNTLLHLERNLRPQDDFGVLIGWASQLSESILVRLLADELRPLATRLAEILDGLPKYRSAAEVLQMWGDGRRPPTLGTLVNILLALRKAESLNQTDVQDAVGRLYTEQFVELLRSKELAQSLNVIRDRFRNPVAHGLKRFDRQEYEDFLRLVVAQRRFADWDLWGADPSEPPANQAVLHHHLVGYRWHQFESNHLKSSPLSRLIKLSTPPESTLKVKISVERADRIRVRELRPAKIDAGPIFRLGDEITIKLSVQQSAYVLLVDIGTASTVAVLWPNQWYSDPYIEAGTPQEFPGPRCPERLILQGATGTEYLLAFATTDPWPTEWNPENDEPFREMKQSDINRLLAHVSGLNARNWAIARTAIEIVD